MKNSVYSLLDPFWRNILKSLQLQPGHLKETDITITGSALKDWR
jgi:hypothetical protein